MELTILVLSLASFYLIQTSSADTISIIAGRSITLPCHQGKGDPSWFRHLEKNQIKIIAWGDQKKVTDERLKMYNPRVFVFMSI